MSNDKVDSLKEDMQCLIDILKKMLRDNSTKMSVLCLLDSTFNRLMNEMEDK